MAKLSELFPNVNFVVINWGEHNFHMNHVLSQLKDNADHLATDRGKCYLMEDFTKHNWCLRVRKLTFIYSKGKYKRDSGNGRRIPFRSKRGVQYRIEGDTIYL